MKNVRLKIFLCVIYVISFICFIVAYKLKNFEPFTINIRPTAFDILIFIALYLFLEYFIIAHGEVAISTSYAVTIASVMYFGVFWSMIINSVAIALRVVNIHGKIIHVFNTPFYKILFNISIISISIFTSEVAYSIYRRAFDASSILYMAIGFVIFVFIFLITDALIISLVMSALTGSKLHKTYASYIKIGFLDIVFVSPFGVILFYLYKFYGAAGAVLLLIPIVMLRYVFKLYTD